MAPTKNPLSPDTRRKIFELWKSPDFSGSFSGINTVQKALKKQHNITASQKDLREILSSEPNYLKHLIGKSRYERRNYSNVRGWGCLWQLDLGFMIPWNNISVFLIAVDVASRNIYVKVLKDAKGRSVVSALKELFQEQTIPKVIETDQGPEFIAAETQKLFRDNEIYFKLMAGQHKAWYSCKMLAQILVDIHDVRDNVANILQLKLWSEQLCRSSGKTSETSLLRHAQNFA
jgi:transposase InsO family protein